MKQIYINTSNIEIHLKTGRVISIEDDALCGRYQYYYAECQEKAEREDIFSDFPQYLAQRNLLWCSVKKHKRNKVRKLLYIRRSFNQIDKIEKVYEDEIESITIWHCIKVVADPKWEYLTEDLTFNELTELLYNREQELKKEGKRIGL